MFIFTVLKNKNKTIMNTDKLKFENWDTKDLFEYLYHLRDYPTKRNKELEKVVSQYINNYR